MYCGMCGAFQDELATKYCGHCGYPFEDTALVVSSEIVGVAPTTESYWSFKLKDHKEMLNRAHEELHGGDLTWPVRRFIYRLRVSRHTDELQDRLEDVASNTYVARYLALVRVGLTAEEMTHVRRVLISEIIALRNDIEAMRQGDGNPYDDDAKAWIGTMAVKNYLVPYIRRLAGANEPGDDKAPVEQEQLVDLLVKQLLG